MGHSIKRLKTTALMVNALLIHPCFTAFTATFRHKFCCIYKVFTRQEVSTSKYWQMYMDNILFFLLIQNLLRNELSSKHHASFHQLDGILKPGWTPMFVVCCKCSWNLCEIRAVAFRYFCKQCTEHRLSSDSTFLVVKSLMQEAKHSSVILLYVVKNSLNCLIWSASAGWPIPDCNDIAYTTLDWKNIRKLIKNCSYPWVITTTNKKHTMTKVM